MKTWIRLAAYFVVIFALQAGSASAWTYHTDARWRRGPIPMSVLLADQPVLPNGTRLADHASRAVGLWNGIIRDVRFETTIAPSGLGASRNGRNELYMTASPLGMDWPSELIAMSVLVIRGSEIVEGDILLSSTARWDDTDVDGANGMRDIQRHVVREAGYVLGLGNPRTAAQDVRSVMNDYGYWRVPTDDDQEGASRAYGAGPFLHAIEIYRQPEPLVLEYEVGESLTLEVLSNGTTWQWYKDGVAIVGASQPLFSRTLTAADSGVYSVIVGNAYGKSLQCFTSKISVSSTPLPPRISRQPAPMVAKEGSYASCRVEYLSRTDVSIAWYKDGVLLPGSIYSILSLSDVKTTDVGNYEARLTNRVGTTVTAPATLTVLPPDAPVLGVLPTKKLIVEEGQPGLVQHGATGVHLRYEWFLNGNPVSPDRKPYVDSYYGSLRLPEFGKQDEGFYTCVVSNNGGAVTTPAVWVSVVPARLPRRSSYPGVVRGREGERVRIFANDPVNLYDGERVQWYKEGVPMPGKTDANSLELDPLEQQHAADYWVTISNRNGVVRSNPVRLEVLPSRADASGVVTDGVLYWLMPDKVRIGRLRIADKANLGAIDLPGKVQSFAVSSESLFALEAQNFREPYNRLWKLPLSGGGASVLHQKSQTSTGTVFMVGSTVWLVERSPWPDRWFGTLVDSATGGSNRFLVDDNMHPTLEAVVSVPQADRMYGFLRHNGRPHSELISCVPSSGQLSRGVLTGEPPAASFLLAGGTHLVTDSGALFRLADLSAAGTLDLTVEDVAVPAGSTASYLLSQGRVLRVGAGLVVEAWCDAPSGTRRLLSSGSRLWAWDSSATAAGTLDAGLVELTADRFNEGEFKKDKVDESPTLGIAVDLSRSYLGRDGDLRVVDAPRNRLLTWSPAERRFIASQVLRPGLFRELHSPAENVLYLCYSYGLITRLELSAGALETVLVRAPRTVNEMAVDGAGKLMLLMDVYNELPQLAVYDSNTGVPLTRTSFPFDCAPPFVWSNAVGALAQMRTLYTGVPCLTLYPQIGMGTGFSSADKVNVEALDVVAEVGAGARKYVRLDAAGRRLVTGYGHVFDLAARACTASLPVLVECAEWMADGRLLTLSHEAGGTRVRRWSTGAPKEEAVAWLDFAGTSVHALPDGRVLVTGHRRGAPRFCLLDSGLVVLSVDNTGTVSRLVNMSVQADVGLNDDILVPGFVVRGDESKQVLVRAIGPGLNQFHVPGSLADPYMEFFDRGSQSLDRNNDWQESASSARGMAARMAELGAFALDEGSRDAVILPTLPSGAYTAQVSGGVGRSLVELYDADEAPGSMRFVNMSARCRVSGDREVVAGFVVKGDKPLKLLVRAVGPKLADYKVGGVLPDPRLRLFQGQAVIATNDNWDAEPQSGARLKAAFNATGAFELDAGSKDAALLVEVSAGSYTAWMESADGSSGVGLIEVYLLEE